MAPDATVTVEDDQYGYCVALVTDAGEFMVAVCAHRAKVAKRLAAKLVQGTVIEAHAYRM
jgi:hypothetical protein